MITVAGEALMDVVIDVSGSVTALPGGAPFNVARTIARLGGECRFLGRLSDDAFGDQLRTSLEKEGVGIGVPEPTLAKVSVDDLKLLHPQADHRDAARTLLALGPAAVLVTDGPAPVTVHTADTERPVPVPQIDVIDTIGAGDAFVAAFLTWWSNRSLNRLEAGNAEALVDATAAATRVAAAACTIRGANLPDEFDWSAVDPATPIGGLRAPSSTVERPVSSPADRRLS